MEIANTIFRQLGANKFAVMTGAKNFVGSDRALHFSIGSGTKNKANKCRVTLDPSDTYTVEFFSIRAGKVTDKGSFSNVYADGLRELFTRETGFYCSL